MAQHFFSIIRSPQSFVNVSLQQLLYEHCNAIRVFNVIDLFWRKSDLLFIDLEFQIVHCLSLERSLTKEHFVSENTKRPPVDIFVMRLIIKNFWSLVLMLVKSARCASNRQFVLSQIFCVTEIYELDFTIILNQYTLCSQISIADVFAV